MTGRIRRGLGTTTRVSTGVCQEITKDATKHELTGMLECLVFGHLHEFLTSDERFICEEPLKWKRVLHACSFKVCTESNSDFSLTPNFGTDAKDNENIY